MGIEILDWTTILIPGYTLLFALIIYRGSFFSMKTISRKSLIWLFMLKVMVGVIFGLVNYYLIDGRDTFEHFRDGQLIYYSFFEDPYHYIELVFGPNNFVSPPHLHYVISSMKHAYLDTSSYMMIRFHAIVRLFSFGNYFVHVVFMCFFSFSGLTALYRLFTSVYPDRSRLFMIAIYLIPSVLFWGSGPHKDGLMLWALGILLLNFHQLIYQSFSLKRVIYFSIAAALILFVRGYLLVLLLPNFIAFYWVVRRPGNIFKKFLLTSFLYYLLMAQLGALLPGIDPLQKITDMQTQLLKFSGDTDININILEPNVLSMVKSIPQALFNTLLRPHFSDISSKCQFAAFIETYLTLLLLILCLLFNDLKTNPPHPLGMLSIFFSVVYFISIGMIVPNLGTIARYKSTPLLFLVCFLIIIIRSGVINRVKEAFLKK